MAEKTSIEEITGSSSETDGGQSSSSREITTGSCSENDTFLQHRTNMTQTCTSDRKRSIFVHTLAALFGIGSWIGVNATFLQLPLFVETAPEGWRLPSYIVIIMQIGNIGPLAYTVYQKCSPLKIKDSYMIYAVQIIATLAALLAAFLNRKTALVGGEEHSVALFALSFLLALKACTSSVLCMPYMGRFVEVYLVTYLMGEGLSGFIPSIVALIQGVGGDVICIPNNTTEGPPYTKYVPPPRFDSEIFFAFVFVVILCSTLAFVVLDNFKVCRLEYAAVQISYGNSYEYKNPKKDDRSSQDEAYDISKGTYRMLLTLIVLIGIIANGVLPSVQSYSCIPYGYVAYHLAVTLSLTANPVSCLISMYFQRTSIRVVLILISIAGVLAIYILIVALMSPKPPLMNNSIGEVLIITSWTILVGLTTYIKICITTIMRAQGGKSLVLIGAISQAGSATGSIVTFILVNFTKIFVSYEPC